MEIEPSCTFFLNIYTLVTFVKYSNDLPPDTHTLRRHKNNLGLAKVVGCNNNLLVKVDGGNNNLLVKVDGGNNKPPFQNWPR